MEGTGAITIFLFFVFGWIPILAIGKAISMVVHAFVSVQDDIEVNDQKGYQLTEEWGIPNLNLEEVYERQEELNNQGWFTVLVDQDADNDIFELIVYGRARNEVFIKRKD
jgi:hypothetical protein